MPVDYVSPQRASPKDDGFRLTGRHVLAALIAFFIVVATVNAVMMTLAVKTMSGLDARNGYDPSQRYNRDIAEARAQAERGWQVDAQLRPAAGLPGADVVIAMADRAGKAVTGLAVDMRLAHPTDKRRDLTIALEEVAPGRYVGRFAEASPGAWGLIIEARDAASGERLFFTRQRTTLSQAGSKD